MFLEPEEIESATINANAVKEMVLGRLVEDDIITREVAEDYVTNWQIIVINPNWFERWRNKFKPKSDAHTFKYVRFENKT